MNLGRRKGSVTFVALLVFLALGAFAGWLAGLAAQGHGVGTVPNVVVGLVGGVVGGWSFEASGMAPLLAFGGVLFAVFVGTMILFTGIHHLREVRARHERSRQPPFM